MQIDLLSVIIKIYKTNYFCNCKSTSRINSRFNHDEWIDKIFVNGVILLETIKIQKMQENFLYLN